MRSAETEEATCMSDQTDEQDQRFGIHKKYCDIETLRQTVNRRERIM